MSALLSLIIIFMDLIVVKPFFFIFIFQSFVTENYTFERVEKE
jgi:hypothetical protein